MKRELQNPGLRASDQARYMAERPATVLSVRIRKVGDCFSATDDGYYIDCDGCAYNAASATLDAQTGTLYFDDPNGVGIAGTEVEGFAAPTAPANVTVNASSSDTPLYGSFSFSNMTQNQFINEMQNSNFVVSPVDTWLNIITKSHPGTNMRSANAICNVHLNITPGSGENGKPVMGTTTTICSIPWCLAQTYQTRQEPQHMLRPMLFLIC